MGNEQPAGLRDTVVNKEKLSKAEEMLFYFDQLQECGKLDRRSAEFIAGLIISLFQYPPLVLQAVYSLVAYDFLITQHDRDHAAAEMAKKFLASEHNPTLGFDQAAKQFLASESSPQIHQSQTETPPSQESESESPSNPNSNSNSITQEIPASESQSDQTLDSQSKNQKDQPLNTSEHKHELEYHEPEHHEPEPEQHKPEPEHHNPQEKQDQNSSEDSKVLEVNPCENSQPMYDPAHFRPQAALVWNFHPIKNSKEKEKINKKKNIESLD
jgi:hypothetical protein